MVAEEYNKIRRIIFSTANDPMKGFSLAREWLDNTYRKKLGQQGYCGLLAELNFYERNRNLFKLTVAGDMGEHADFAGVYSGEATRFDVTTNIDFKKFRDYEPFLKDEIRYKIALLDKENFEIIDVFDLAFNRCNCGGHLIPFATVFQEPLCLDKTLAMHVCSKCKFVVEVGGGYYQTRISIMEYLGSAIKFSSAYDSRTTYNEYSVDQYKSLRTEFDENIMGIAFPHYLTTVGFWAIEFTFVNNVIDVDLSGQLCPSGWPDLNNDHDDFDPI